MPQIQTPLAQILRPQTQQSFSPAATGQGARIDLLRQEAEQKANLQRLSNLGQAAATGLDVIKSDPENSEQALRTMIDQRRSILPTIGITDMTDTDELEAALNEGGVPAAQELLTGALNAAQSAGFKLPAPTTPSFTGAFQGKDEATGKDVTFLRGKGGEVLNTGIPVVKRAPLVQVGAGGGNKERTQRFGQLFDESKNVDKALGQFNTVRDIVAEGGLGSIGTSGKVTKGIEKAFSALGGFVRNLGIVDDFDEGSIVSQGLAGTPLGEQANRNAKISSLITNLAFTVAQAQNPGGRITDKDFQAAVQTIGASADNPEQLNQVINQFGDNLLSQFETDVEREGAAFGFSKAQFKSLANIPSKKKFLSGVGGQQAPAPTGISATTKPADLTPEQAQELAKNDPDLLRQIIENAKRGQ